MSEDLAWVILNVAILAVAVITVLVAFYLVKLFLGTPFERPWKILFLVPILMTGIKIREILGIEILHVRSQS